MTGADTTLLLIVVTGAFFVKAITGMGGPILAIPLLAPALGFEEAVIAVSFANIMSNLLLVWGNRASARATLPILRRLVPAGVVGAVAGSLILVSVDDRWLSAGLAVVVFSYIGLTVWKGAISLPARVRLKAAVPIGAAGGIVHGATGNSGAVLATYLHSLDLPRSEFVFAATVPFMLLSTVQISTLTLMGRVHEPVLTPALMAMIPVILITPLGTRVGRGLNEHTFSIMVLVLLGIAGLRLVGSVFDM